MYEANRCHLDYISSDKLKARDLVEDPGTDHVLKLFEGDFVAY
jgi:hypothetical protein